MERTFLHPDDAINIIIENKESIGTEKINVANSFNRVLAYDLKALIDDPPFDKSSMDGYVYIKDDDRNLYKICSRDIIFAGCDVNFDIKKEECIKIMTGAKIPEGCNAVQRVEWSDIIEDGKEKFVKFTKKEISSNIIKKASNKKKDEPLIDRRILCAKDIGILASFGYGEISVRKIMKVGIVSTGEEIIAAGEKLDTGNIYDSNGPALIAQSKSLGLDAKFYGIINDDIDVIEEILLKMFDENDIILVSGGVSMGDFDYIPKVLDRLKVNGIFHGVAMKPGKPLFFGKKGRKAVFGLPGNPVSAFITFENMVKPYVISSLGLDYKPIFFKALLLEDIKRKDTDRQEFVPALISYIKEKICINPIFYNNSSMISSFANANAIIKIDIGTSSLSSGEIVNARLI